MRSTPYHRTSIQLIRDRVHSSVRIPHTVNKKKTKRINSLLSLNISHVLFLMSRFRRDSSNFYLSFFFIVIVVVLFTARFLFLNFISNTDLFVWYVSLIAVNFLNYILCVCKWFIATRWNDNNITQNEEPVYKPNRWTSKCLHFLVNSMKIWMKWQNLNRLSCIYRSLRSKKK